jgi:hypothetical protein
MQPMNVVACACGECECRSLSSWLVSLAVLVVIALAVLWQVKKS